MPKNGPKGNSFELLSESNDDESITVETTSARGRPLKRTQPFEPNSPPRAKRTNSTKATIPRPALAISSSDEWMMSIRYGGTTLGSEHTLIGERYTESSGIL
ncbi:hypothetical protein DL95DRAFT_394009 [Leptodontidium sp. 2 PMI_412]|nr:hypothetical protein DL95DRAFT_394009 [Leptodontidium sp. 2 PMI_412]